MVEKMEEDQIERDLSLLHNLLEYSAQRNDILK